MLDSQLGAARVTFDMLGFTLADVMSRERPKLQKQLSRAVAAAPGDAAAAAAESLSLLGVSHGGAGGAVPSP